MRDFLKSTLRFSWAMSLFGVQQLENMVEDPSQTTNKTTTAFDSVTRATEAQLSGVVKSAFEAGDQLQSGVVDSVFAGLPGQPHPQGSTATAAGAASGQQPPTGGAGATTQIVPVNSGRLNINTFIVLGEGLAAGMGDFTLSDVTQVDSFPAQMARQMQTRFPQPLIQAPGICSPVGFAELPVILPVPPQDNVLDQLPPTPVNNLSVPGYRLSDALNLRPSQPLVQRHDAKQTAANLILGANPIAYGKEGRLPTQLECAVNRKPTFTIIELGYSDVLEAAVKSDSTKLGDVNSFRSNYAAVFQALRNCGSEVLALTIPDPFDTAHFSSVNRAAKILKVAPDLLRREYNLKEHDLITPNGLNEIGFQLFGKQMDVLPEGCVVSASVAAEVGQRIKELNAALAAVAKEQGVLVYDLHAFLHRIKDQGITIGSRKLSAEYLGGFYSLNGYYPGATGQARIANELLTELNIAYGSDFPQIDVPRVMQRDSVAAYRQAEGPDWTANQLPQPPMGAAASTGIMAAVSRAVTNATGEQSMSGWEELGQPQATSPGHLRLPPTLEQVLPLSKAASYFGDGIAALNCRDPQGIQWGGCGSLLFGGLALVDSHLSGNLRIRFTPPQNSLTHFEVSFLNGFTGDDSVLTTPQFFKMAFQQNRVDDVPGMVSSGTLNLATGEVSDLKVYARYSSTALMALVSVNPTFPRQPLGFPGPYGSAMAKFAQRPDGLLDFTFYGSTFVPLGNNIVWPLNFFSATQQFATVPANGTVMHPHLQLSTREPEASHEVCPDIPFNTIQELTLFTHNSSFGDAFTLNSPELGGKVTGRSHVLGRVMLQFGERCGNSVPVAVSLLNSGAVMAPMAASPLTQVFPGRLYPGPHGFDEILRFPLRNYSLNDLAILGDPFDICVGTVDLKSGKFLNQLLLRGFINQDLIFALLRVEPRTPKDSFFFRGPAAIESGTGRHLIFRFAGEVHIPYPEGFLFPTPNLTTGIVIGPHSSLDPFLWLHAIQDEVAPYAIKHGSARDVIASTGERFSYSYKISADPTHESSFAYENHTQQGKFRMHSVAWVGFSNSTGSKRRSGEYDTATFTGFGVWSKDGSETVQQVTVQVSTSPQRPYVGIQIDAGNVSGVNTKPVSIEDVRP